MMIRLSQTTLPAMPYKRPYNLIKLFITSLCIRRFFFVSVGNFIHDRPTGFNQEKFLSVLKVVGLHAQTVHG